MSKELETNFEAFKQFQDFTLQQMKKAIKGALAEGSKLLQKETKEELVKEIPKAKVRNKNYFDTLQDAVMWRIEKTGTSAKIHIMGTKKKGSGTFRARFFERGTKNNVRGRYYFKNAQSKVGPQISSTFEQVLAKHINKINNSK